MEIRTPGLNQRRTPLTGYPDSGVLPYSKGRGLRTKENPAVRCTWSGVLSVAKGRGLWNTGNPLSVCLGAGFPAGPGSTGGNTTRSIYHPGSTGTTSTARYCPAPPSPGYTPYSHAALAYPVMTYTMLDVRATPPWALGLFWPWAARALQQIVD